MNRPKVGVIGLGSMGGGVARSQLRAGFAVCDVRPAVVRSVVKASAIARPRYRCNQAFSRNRPAKPWMS